MTWGKVAGELHSHPKWTNASPEAKAMWTTALSYCSEHLTNGAVHEHQDFPMISLATFGNVKAAAKGADRAAADLVTRGLWERTTSGWKFHDWKACNPTAQQVKQRKKKDHRRDELHKTSDGRKIKAQVRARDGDECRYCLTMVRWGANRATDGGTFDHVDPDGQNTLENVVVACNYCNGRKRDISPAEAGMVLQPIPADRADQHQPDQGGAEDGTRLSRDSIATQSSRINPPGTGRDGTERIESDRLVPGQGRANDPLADLHEWDEAQREGTS